MDTPPIILKLWGKPEMKKYLSLSLAAFLGLSIVGCAPEATEPAPVDNVSDVDPADHEMPGAAAHSPEGGSTEGGEAAPAEGGEAAPAEGGEAAPAEGGEAAPAAE
ncbi:MAG: hypothetical protein KDA69_04305, partial [Planctomycetaceae bacterium]|nr:hypothetical protein [Planctomycetaceae bacterium]